MQAVTITQITPSELETLIESTLKKILSFHQQSHPADTDQWFNLVELCNYLPDKPAKATIYGYVAGNSIPCHKGPKKLRFLKSEIDAWIKTGKVKTSADHAADADNFLDKQKRRRQVA